MQKKTSENEVQKAHQFKDKFKNGSLEIPLKKFISKLEIIQKSIFMKIHSKMGLGKKSFPHM